MFIGQDDLVAQQAEDGTSEAVSKTQNTLLIYVRSVPPADQREPFQECQAEVLLGADDALDKALRPGSLLNACAVGLPTNLAHDRYPECKMFQVSCLERTRLAPTGKLSAQEVLQRLKVV